MRPKKDRKPYVLYRRGTKSGPVWYARFWDGDARRYAPTRSTGIPAEGKKERRHEAEQAARNMLPGIRFAPALPAKPFTRYAADFWTMDSPYAREHALVKKRPLSAAYVLMNHENVRRHMEPFSGFRGLTLQCLTPGDIRDWMAWMSDRGSSGRLINQCLQAMRVAVRYAVGREEIDRDPFRNVRPAAEDRREKGILAPAEVSRLITSPVRNPYARLAVLLGLLCGMRRGEVRGCQWEDISEGMITIRHNYQEIEGVKSPKCGSSGIVPMPGSVLPALDMVRSLSENPAPAAFVLHNLRNPDKPLSPKYFQRALADELAGIGIPGDEQKRRNLTFHGLRHTYITLGRMAGISDIEIQALARHKSGKMMERYSHAEQVMDFSAAREKLERAVGGITGTT